MLDNPFQLDNPPGTLHRRASLAIARPLLSWILKADTLGELYRRMDHDSSESFENRVLRLLEVEPVGCEEDLSTIPARGPLIVASNHPQGALDGLVLASLLRRVRGDVRLLANSVLERIPELRESCFFVDPFGGPMAASRSRAGLRAAHLWLRQGGALIMFPAGSVASRRGAGGAPVDDEWKDTVGRLALQTGARVVPAFIEGSNSSVFYAAGRLHPVLRTLLLGRELLNKRGRPCSVRVGAPLSPRKLAGDLTDAAGVTARMRAASDRLSERVALGGHASEAADTIAAEISRLPPAQRLAESGPFEVFCCDALQIPAALREIGRLRAVTYRAAGEGTGSAVDLDTFDEHYLHLFLWDRERRQVVGAYRLGRTDRIVQTDGVEGLYTRTLFRYDRRFVDRLSPALELGRSFVRAEYQRNHSALLLLWKGIGRFVTLHPEYRVLFGPVSISTRYSNSSHAMLMAFLEQNHLDRPLAELVEAIHPPDLQRAAPPAVAPRTIDEVNRLVSTIEGDGKSMPVLLRHYLKLNARLIAFNVDPDFGEALDALMMVDLGAVDPAILGRYLGREGAAQFLAFHRRAA